jgi:hypothetical protein
LKLTNKPNLPPKKCLVTGRSDGDLVDFGVDLGGPPQRLYLRRQVVEKAGLLLGMIPEHTHEELKGQIADLEAKFEEYDKRIAKLGNLMEMLDD